jgi:hypothetical protein
MAKNNEKTLADFNKLVSETKSKFLRDKMDYKLNYTIKEEKMEGFEYFIICNILTATKLIYSHEMKFIVHKEMLMDDVRTLTEMKESL